MKAQAQPGALMLASIPANDIMLATHKSEGLSARNIVPARITQLRSVGPVGLVTAEVATDLPPLTVEVTETSFVELGLQVDHQIFLVIKAFFPSSEGDYFYLQLLLTRVVYDLFMMDDTITKCN